MTTVRHPAENLIHDLAAAFVDKPEALLTSSQVALDGAIYFSLKGHPIDEGRLVGTKGCHVDALTFLLVLVGQAQDERFTFRLITRQEPRQNKPLDDRHVVSYDPERIRQLLARILDELGFDNCAVSVGPWAGAQHSLSFSFTIKPESSADYELLMKEIKAVIFPATEVYAEKSMTLRIVEVLGTIFRAIAKKDGVRFSIVVEDPRCA